MSIWPLEHAGALCGFWVSRVFLLTNRVTIATKKQSSTAAHVCSSFQPFLVLSLSTTPPTSCTWSQWPILFKTVSGFFAFLRFSRVVVKSLSNVVFDCVLRTSVGGVSIPALRISCFRGSEWQLWKPVALLLIACLISVPGQRAASSHEWSWKQSRGVFDDLAPHASGSSR